MERKHTIALLLIAQLALLFSLVMPNPVSGTQGRLYFGLFLLSCWLITVCAALILVAKDARAKGAAVWLWPTIAFFLGPLGIAAYLVVTWNRPAV